MDLVRHTHRAIETRARNTAINSVITAAASNGILGETGTGLADAVNPNLPLAQRIQGGLNAVNGAVDALHNYISGRGSTPNGEVVENQQQVNENTPNQPISQSDRGARRRLEFSEEPEARRQRLNMEEIPVQPMEAMNLQDQPGAASNGAVIASGGLRTNNIFTQRSNTAYSTLKVRKTHHYKIRAHTEKRTPAVIENRNAPGFYTEVQLETDWYELPSNTLGFYCDAAELHHLQNSGTYWRVKDAAWLIKKGDLFTVNTAGDNVKAIQSQWQPALRVADDTACIPPTRNRLWTNDNNVEAIDNSYDKVFAVCGQARQGFPQWLPRIKFTLKEASGHQTDVIEPAVGLVVPYSGNLRDTGGHLDILRNCIKEYEQTFPNPIGNIMRPFPFWRCTQASPFQTFDYQTLISGQAPVGGPRQQIFNVETNDFSSTMTMRPYDRFTKSSLYPTKATDSAIVAPMHRELVGPNTFYASQQYRNQFDGFFPHITPEALNKPTFFSLSKPPDLGQNTDWAYLMEIETEITFELETPLLNPFNNNTPEIDFSTGATINTKAQWWGGDNRVVYFKNDVLGESVSGLNYEKITSSDEVKSNSFVLT